MLLAKLTPRWPHHAGETTLAMAPFCWRATATVESQLVVYELSGSDGSRINQS